MNIISLTFKRHKDVVLRNRITSLLVLLFSAWVVYCGFQAKTTAHALGYIFAVWFGAFVTDAVTIAYPKTAIGFPIKKPVKWELFTIVICSLLGVVMLVIRFEGNWNSMNGVTRLCLLPLFLFVFPIALAIIYLFRYKYRPKELGINLHYWYLPIFIHIIVGAVTLLLAPEVSHWKEMLKEMGLLDMLVTGLLTAALPEEFLRMLLQTRLAKALNNTGLGFLVASVIWAAMHIPVFGQNHETTGWSPAIIGALTKVPIGLLWGYVTYRTRSLIPSVLIHGLNLWGLQNI